MDNYMIVAKMGTVMGTIFLMILCQSMSSLFISAETTEDIPDTEVRTKVWVLDSKLIPCDGL